MFANSAKERFVTEVTNLQAIHNRIPQQTLQTTNWLYGIWNSWYKARKIADELIAINCERCL